MNTMEGFVELLQLVSEWVLNGIYYSVGLPLLLNNHKYQSVF